jgi:hypothetical protein
MRMSRYLYLISFSTIIAAGCKKPYAPNIADSNSNYLVVEGLIDIGPDSTFVKLSRTVNVSAKISHKPELYALLEIEGDDNTNYPLQEKGNGVYVCAPLNSGGSHKYRLSIKTIDNKTYLSDYVEAKIAPEIDSLGYVIKSNGVQIYANTHDNSNKTRYYRWDFNETWRFRTTYDSYYTLVNAKPVFRPPDQHVYECWGNDTSTSVNVRSTANLSKDVLAQQPIVFLQSIEEKLTIRYSILLKQYALTQAGYAYYVNLKKNTEQLGDIFDAQPSSVKGNITCTTNPSEPVLGFISAGTVTTKRIFIDNHDLPEWRAITYYDLKDCAGDTIKLADESLKARFYAGPPYSYLPTVSPDLAAPIECVDCTLRGTTKKPDFWK